jgi:hypothetical protein
VSRVVAIGKALRQSFDIKLGEGGRLAGRPIPG